jgi:ABC-2 type transport system ATP-binding protein
MTIASLGRLDVRSGCVASRSVAVEIRALTKRYQRRRGWGETLRRPLTRQFIPVVRSVTCEIREGEFFGLLGLNGAGKTTLFKLLASLVSPDDGTAIVAGFDIVRDRRDVRRVLSPAIANERSLFWRLSARENLRLFATLHGLPAREAVRRVDEVMDLVGLGRMNGELVGTFSSGMKQRLLVARALLPRPKVLLLDEPTRSLDPISAREFRRFLREEIARQQTCTILLATHSADEAFELCGRVGILHRGALLAIGPAADLAREVGLERYRVWTRHPAHPSWATLHDRGVLRIVGTETGEDGWTCVQADIEGGLGRTAHVIDVLNCAGVSVGRFERVGLSLAELIERVVTRGDAEVGGA